MGRSITGKLENKVAIVTGASYSMGRAEAILFAKESAKVVCAARTISKGEETVKMIKEAGGEAIFVRTDVASKENVKNMIKIAVDTYGRLVWLNKTAYKILPLLERLA